MKASLKRWKYGILFLLAIPLLSVLLTSSSHREAPLIADDPLADNTDLYAFRSPANPDKVIIIANYIPFELPQGGPNYYNFATDVRYEIHVDNDVKTVGVPNNVRTRGDDIIYRFTFTNRNEDPTTFFNVRLGKENLHTHYKVERSINGKEFTTILAKGIVPVNNIGPRSIESPVGLGINYETRVEKNIFTTSTGEKVFAGPRDDPFFVDLGGIFDLADAPRQGGTPRDGLAKYNVHSIALEIDISTLQKDGKSVDKAKNILDDDYIIGVWASASRKSVRTLNTSVNSVSDKTQSYSGEWIQVSRIGMPLTNEVITHISDKNYWNQLTPYDDLGYLKDGGGHLYNPELALYMDERPGFFGSAVPAFAPLRIQPGFRNGENGLFALKGTKALNGTVLGDPKYSDLLLPGPGKPRSVDLYPIFNTGVPNRKPYQLATGKKDGNPLAAGKPFINNFLPNGGDMLRLNMAVPVTPRNSSDFNSLGLVWAVVLGLTDSRYNQNKDLQFIPNMDGFPNGRRLEDDVTRIELQAVSGIVLRALGIPYADDATRLGQVLSYSTGVEKNDAPFMTKFPFLATPWRGTEVQ